MNRFFLRTCSSAALALTLVLFLLVSTAHARNGLPASYLLDRLPSNALEIGEAMKKAKIGEKIAIRGRITDGNDVFVPNRAIFRLADESAVPSCCPRVVGGLPSNQSCGVPANMRATIQFVDSRGRLLRTGLQGKHGLVVSKEVFIIGTVHQTDNDRVLIINATNMHVPQGDIPFDFVLKNEPRNVLDVVDAKRQVKPGDEVAIRGRVGGSAHPFVDGRAVFTIVGRGPHACSDHDDDHCKTPWDYCCTPRDELRAHSATIQVVDDAGAPIRSDIKGRHGIRELSDLTILGEVVTVDENVLIVKAKGVYINRNTENE
jgi:hypothetical protein